MIMSNVKHRWTNGRIQATRPEVPALRERAARRIDARRATGFATADAAASVADINTECDDEGWIYTAVPMANATAEGFAPTNDGRWTVMVVDADGEVLGYL
jgi:hypothetical protein